MMGNNINRQPLPGWRDWGGYATFSGMGAAELWAAGGSWTLCSIGRSIAGRADDSAAAKLAAEDAARELVTEMAAALGMAVSMREDG